MSVTRLADTPNAVTTNYTYEAPFSLVKTITDPLSYTTTFGYDATGNLTTITDPLNKTTTITPNSAGQPVSIQDALNNITQFSYSSGDLATVTDPMGNVSTRFSDAAGRLRSLTNPMGNLTLRGALCHRLQDEVVAAFRHGIYRIPPGHVKKDSRPLFLLP
jgi:YD repeat-containing protein